MEASFSVLFVSLVLISGGLAQVVDESRMQEVANQLSEKFSKLKNFGMGADSLQRAYSNADITYSPVDVQTMLSSEQYNSRVQSVVGLIETITTSSSSGMTESFEDCCSITQTSNQVCCFQCGESSDQALIGRASYSIANAGLDKEVEFRVGFTNGSVLVYPAVPVQGRCVEEDSRLMAWYNDATEDKVREIVIFLDLNRNGVPGNSTQPALEEAAINVIRSLSRNDRVGLVLVTENNQRACPLRLATEENKNEFIKVIRETLAPGNRVYSVDFTTALGYFSTPPTSNDQLFLLITDGRVTLASNEFSGFESAITASNFSNVEFSIYTFVVPDEASNRFLRYLRPFTSDQKFNSLSDIASYSSVFSTGNPQETIIVTTDFNREHELSLSISRVWKDGATIVGAVNAMLPWRYILEELTDVTVRRTSSYFFVMNQEGTLLYHESFPSTVLVDVSPVLVENDTEFNSLSSLITTGTSPSSVSVNKTTVVHLFNSSYIHRETPSNYRCRRVITIGNTTSADKGLIHACLLLAEHDMTVVESFNVQDIAGIYRGNPSRLPIYHTQVSSPSSTDQCRSSCLLSIEGRVSVQFTSPLTPPNSSLAAISAYIDGSGMRPSEIADNVAEELAIISVVGSQWMSGHYSVPIKRRHLATPTGIYLGFPAIELDPSFVPRYLPWYLSATARRSTLSLSASTSDELDGEGMIYTASYPVIKDGGSVLSVIAADINEESLRIDINSAFSNNLCELPGYDCSVINEYGNFVLHPSEHSSSVALHILDIREYDGIVGSLLINGLLVKLGCNNIASVEVNNRRYFSLRLPNETTLCYSPTTNCLDYCISSISNTNSFLLVVKRKANCLSNALSFCSAVCLDCDDFRPMSIECPCVCNKEVCEEPTRFQFPSCPAQTTPSSNYMGRANPPSHSVGICDEEQCCEYGESDCGSSPFCNWCSTQSSCVPVGSCCSGNISCCTEEVTPNCFRAYCLLANRRACPLISPSPTPTDSTTSSSSVDRQAAIVGGVIGGVFGILFLGLLIGCCVWYQLFKGPESIAAAKQKSEFNFTDIKVSTTNHTALALQEKETPPNNIKEEDGGSKEQLSPTFKNPMIDVVV